MSPATSAFGARSSSCAISTYLDPARRGEGLGTAAILAGINRHPEDASVAVVYAFIKQTNPASLRVFQACATRGRTDIAQLRLQLEPRTR